MAIFLRNRRLRIVHIFWQLGKVDSGTGQKRETQLNSIQLKTQSLVILVICEYTTNAFACLHVYFLFCFSQKSKQQHDFLHAYYDCEYYNFLTCMSHELTF